MPIYTYKCVDCCAVFESFEKMDAPPPPCKVCGEATEKKITGTRIRRNEPWLSIGQRFK